MVNGPVPMISAGSVSMFHVSVKEPSSTCFLKDVLWVYRRTHGAEERGERPGEYAFDRVVVQRGDRHRLLLPFSDFLVQETEMERRFGCWPECRGCR